MDLSRIMFGIVALSLAIPAHAAANEEPPPQFEPNPCGYPRPHDSWNSPDWDVDMDGVYNCLDSDYTWAEGHPVGTHPAARPPASAPPTQNEPEQTQPATTQPVDGGNNYVTEWIDCAPIRWRGRMVQVATIDFRCAVARPMFARYLRTGQTGAFRCSRTARSATCDGVKNAAVRGRWRV